MTPGCAAVFQPLENVIAEQLLPSMLASEVSSLERTLFSLPTRQSGLGVRDPTKFSALANETSRLATQVIREAIRKEDYYDRVRHVLQMNATKKKLREKQNAADKAALPEVREHLDAKRVRAVDRAIDEKTSSWLNVLSVSLNNFELTATEFRDALSIRYGRPLLVCPGTCDCCGAPFSLQHALACKKGGLAYRRHDEIRGLNHA